MSAERAPGAYDSLTERVARWADRGVVNDVALRQVELEAQIAIANELAAIRAAMQDVAQSLDDMNQSYQRRRE
jgi:hypothetical protein